MRDAVSRGGEGWHVAAMALEGSLRRYVACSLSPFETAREARNTEKVPREHNDDSMVPTEPR